MPQKFKTDTLSTSKIAWHSFALGDVFLHLNSKRDGLTEEEAQSRLKHFGPNKFDYLGADYYGKLSWLKTLGRQLIAPIEALFLILISLCLLAGFYFSALLLVGVLAVNLIIVFIWLNLASDVDKKKTGLLFSAIVKRSGNFRKIKQEEVVPGDIILLRPGDIVPADARLVQDFNLETDDSPVTGQYKTSPKTVQTLSLDTALNCKSNMVWGGCGVVNGTAEAVVFDTGNNLEIVQVQKKQHQRFLGLNLPFKQKIDKLAWFMIAGAAVLALGSLVGESFLQYPLANTLELIILILSAAIPQDLVLAGMLVSKLSANQTKITDTRLSSFLTIEKMAEINVVMLDQPSLEVENSLQLIKILTPERIAGIFELNSVPQHGSNHNLLLSYALLATEVIVENSHDEPDSWVIHGSEISRTLIRQGAQIGLDWSQLNRKFKKLSEITFNSQHRLSISFRQNPEGEIWALFMGSPEVILNRVKRIQIINRAENVILSELVEIKEESEKLIKTGLQMVVVCAKKIENKSFLSAHLNGDQLKELVRDLTLVGLIAFKADFEKDIGTVLSLNRAAGLKTVLATYNETVSALTWAKQTGLVPGDKSIQIMTGPEIEIMDIKELTQKIKNIDVFCRLNLEHKLKIIQAWQALGQKVLVFSQTAGDNSVLAQADMGVTTLAGSDSSKAIAKLVLAKNSYHNLWNIIIQSRGFWQCLRQVAFFILTLNLAEVVFLALSFTLKLGLPINLIQLTMINLIFTGLMTTALILPPAIAKPPRSLLAESQSKNFLDNWGISFISAGGLILGLTWLSVFYFFKTYFDSLIYASTISFIIISFTVIFLGFSIQNSPKPIWQKSIFFSKGSQIFIGLIAIILGLVIYWPGFNTYLGFQPVGFWELIVLIGISFLAFIIIELGKWFFIRRLAQNKLK